MDIRDNIVKIKENIEKTCSVAGSNNKVKLIAVTKYVDVKKISEAVSCGVSDLGENRVQEFLSKLPSVQNVNWHLIGHLQTNKVKKIVGKVELIQSVDSIKLAKEINKRASDLDIIQNILLELKTSYEETKFGISIDEFEDVISSVSELSNISINGIMTIAPKVENEDMARPYFKKAHDIFEKYKNVKQPNIDFKYLSMGMSGDYRAAIKEGSNMVRVGTAIFGKRI
jgi:hypothetical protein